MLSLTLSIPGLPEEHRTFGQTVIKIGRLPSAHLHIQDESVSRLHAVIEVEGDVVTVIDLGSSSGTFVNDERTNKKVLVPGDRVRIGLATLTIEPVPVKQLLLPSPEIVRDHFGSSFSPANVFGVAAIVLRVDGVRRHAWSDETELAERLFQSYPRGAIPAPELVPESRNFKTIDDAESTNTRRCSRCIIRPGFEPCPLCLGSGSGSGSGSDPHAKCYACSGAAFIPCSGCDGTTRVVACAVRYVNDHFVRMRRVIMPPVHASIRSFIEARISADAPWSKEQVFDPEPGMVASAYRGASAVRATEDFHGFFFGDAAARALAARAEATTGLARFETSTFAIPILWTVTGEPTRGERHDAYFFDASGALQHVS